MKSSVAIIPSVYAVSFRLLVVCSFFVLVLTLCFSFVDDVYAQTAPKYPALQTTLGNNDPSLAYGLEGLTDWSNQMPFIDLMKTSREWLGHRTGQYGGMTYAELKAGGHLDTNGWPTELPTGINQIGTVWDWSGSSAYGGAASRAGNYVLTYEGEGTIMLFGAQKETCFNLSK